MIPSGEFHIVLDLEGNWFTIDRRTGLTFTNLLPDENR